MSREENRCASGATPLNTRKSCRGNLGINQQPLFSLLNTHRNRRLILTASSWRPCSFWGPARSLFLLQCPVFLLYVPTSPCFSPCFFAFDPEESIGSQFEKLKLINCLFEGVERDKRAGMPGLTDPKPPRCLHRLKDERATPPSWGWEPLLWGSLSPWGRDFTKIRACFDWKGIFFSPEDLYT